MLKNLPAFLLFLAFGWHGVQPVASQNTLIGGVINHYATLAAYDSCTGILAVSDTVGFYPGYQIIVLHVQGGEVATGNNAQFGSVTNIAQVGYWELATIAWRYAGALEVEKRLQYPLSSGEIVQVISFPAFENATVVDTLRPLPWDGQKGGVVALKVKNTLSLNAPVMADGAGFRGGVSYLAPNNNCTWLLGENNYSYALGNWRGGTKGEGATLGMANFELGRGPWANGGGGGNDHNSGGGGGANTSAGGRGGNNDEPSTFGCDGYFPGLGGRAMPASDFRIYFGGGGGAGHTNNGYTSDGGNGGGIVIVDAGFLAGDQLRITANGVGAMVAEGDGGGGGGAGGTIVLNLANLPEDLRVEAQGGKGGNTNASNGNRCFGPGGGGSGGRILCSTTNTNFFLTGGQAGQVINTTNSCNGTSVGATAGEAGSWQASANYITGVFPVLPPVVLAQPLSQTACFGDSVHFSWATNPVINAVQWQINTGNGWLDIPGATSPVYHLPSVTNNLNGAQFRCQLAGGNCYTLNSSVATLQVIPSPVPAFDAILDSPGVFSFSNLSQFADGYIWDFGDGQNSNNAMPVHEYTESGEFEVTLTAWNACDTVSTAVLLNVDLPPVGSILVADTIIGCGTVNVQFSNNFENYTFINWVFTGGTPGTSTELSPIINYTQSGSYPVLLVAAGGSWISNAFDTIAVVVLTTPIADFTAQPISGSLGVQFNFTGIGNGNTIVSWDFGDGSPVNYSIHPYHLYDSAGIFKVRLTVQNECGVSVLEQLVTLSQPDPSNTSDLVTSSMCNIQIYPNPAQDKVWIKSGSKGIQIVDWTGRVLLHLAAFQEGLLEIAALPAGVYWVKSGCGAAQFFVYR